MQCKVELTEAYGKSLVGKTSLRLDAFSFLFNYTQSAYLVFKSLLHFTFMNITRLWHNKHDAGCMSVHPRSKICMRESNLQCTEMHSGKQD